MRILQLIQKKQLRGAEVFACQLANNLIALGHEVKVVALLDGEAALPFDGDVEVIGINLKSRMLDYKGWKALAAIIKQFNPDIVQANAGDTLKYAAFSKKLFGWKAKLVFRNANKMGDFINAAWKKTFNNWLIREVDFVASVSEECRIDFVKVFSWPGNKISTLPIGVDEPVKATHNPLVEKHFEHAFPVLLSVAGFVPEKNHTALIEIFADIKKQYTGAVLIMIGEGRLKTTIADKCNALGTNKSVWFAGRRNDVPAFMQHSQALLMPSLIEGLPGVILEAFANQLPVVAYNVGGIPEVVVDGKTGFLVNKGDQNAFTQKVLSLLQIEDDDLLQLKLRAKALTGNEYQNKSIAHRFAESYQALLQVPQKQYA